MPPVLLDVLAVVALRVGQAEEPLLEAVVVAVPEGDAEVEKAEPVAETGDAVLTPPVGAAMGLLERERLPGIAARGVVLAHRAPLAGRQVGAPEPPRVGGAR